MANENVRQRVFRRMLAREAGTGADAPAIAAASLRLCEHLAGQLTPLIGDAGVAAICARSVHLTGQNIRGFTPVPAAAQGVSPFAYLQHALAQQEPAAAAEAAVAVLDAACELLTSFIGASLTDSLLRDAWPEDFAGEPTEDS